MKPYLYMVCFRYRFAGFLFCCQNTQHWAGGLFRFQTPEKEKKMETVDYKKVGERIRALREEAGVGLREIAAEFNLSNKSVVSAYENGRRALPADVAVRYADKYGVTTDWILRGVAPKFRAELNSDGEKDYSELKALFMKLNSETLRTVAIEQLRALAKAVI